MFTNPTTPNLPDFTAFCYAQGVPTSDLPDTSPYLAWALDYGQALTLYVPPPLPSKIYVLAVYNLSFHRLLKIAQDQQGQTFFTDQRAAFSLLSFVTGPVASSGDVSTNQVLVVPEWMKNMTMATNDLLKTPWGRAYLEYAQSYGPNIVGVS